MRKFFITILFVIALMESANGQFTKIGGGMAYGTGFRFSNESSGFLSDLNRSPFAAIFVNGIYEINLPFHIAPSFTFFLPRTNESVSATNAQKTRVSEMMLDVNGHYVFNSLDRIEFYGLAGMNITFTNIKWINTTSSGSDNAFGLNLGAGTYVKVTEKFDIYAEAKYILSKYDQVVVNLGVLLNIDWMKKHEDTGM
jgi:opacity protein-like surface antigen